MSYRALLNIWPLDRLRAAKRRHTLRKEVDSLFIQWRAMHIDTVMTERRTTVRRLMIVPCDPWTLTGSKGDEAMIAGAIDHLNQEFGSIEVFVGVASESARLEATRKNMTPFPLDWDGPWNPESAADALRRFDPDMVLTLGADVMDGYYSPMTTARLLVFADVAARMNIRSIILGFSFNEHPSDLVRQFFDALDPRLTINIRDPISFTRFRKFTSARARLVADAAFLLKADSDTGAAPEVAGWVARQRADGRLTLAFNIHPMLIRNATPAQRARLIEMAVQALGKVVKERPVSVVLLSHDYRGTDGDDACLEPIHAALRESLADRLIYPTIKMSAAQLKGVAGCVDGVITGRMHLAIASLGQGVPVAALTYQDKFQGLFAHFGMPSDLLVSTEKLIDSTALEFLINIFVERLAILGPQIRDKLSDVRCLSEINLAD